LNLLGGAPALAGWLAGWLAPLLLLLAGWLLWLALLLGFCFGWLAGSAPCFGWNKNIVENQWSTLVNFKLGQVNFGQVNIGLRND